MLKKLILIVIMAAVLVVGCVVYIYIPSINNKIDSKNALVLVKSHFKSSFIGEYPKNLFYERQNGFICELVDEYVSGIKYDYIVNCTINIQCSNVNAIYVQRYYVVGNQIERGGSWKDGIDQDSESDCFKDD